jgi:nitroreductase
MSLPSKPIIEIIPERFSCRTYLEEPIPAASLLQLQEYINTLPAGPFGSKPRFKIVAATPEDPAALRGLGTYGFIHGATAFLVGASQPVGYYLEDFGFLMEEIILAATRLGLGTCWLGGSFTRSSFEKRISIQPGEEIPAVTAMGMIADEDEARNGLIRRKVGAQTRRGWERMFWDKGFGSPLSKGNAGNYAVPLEMIRLGPSASNKQPWQIVRIGTHWHFYLRRTEGYRVGAVNKTLKIADIQRLDIGIAMCHFELTCMELGLPGKWTRSKPDLELPSQLLEYVVTWSEEAACA